ncbi:PREDICTED: probable N-acetyltransferase 8B-like [Elephantulus edwardii]|uniref:probable N-acetyltransferase 8B-like n=1 Tax=Elephantulus edwardii TaxID=28737 RepID=UPI0003F0B733|nr:PREDICTED: probable N-acetyltransferase 8B-like [Elephantulus edwardii]
MASYHIRRYRESDRKQVLELYCWGMAQYYSITFRHLLKLPRTHVLLLGGPLALYLASGSWALALLADVALLGTLWLLARYIWLNIMNESLLTDMADITKAYFSEPGSCFWVAECREKVVGIVACLQVGDPTLRGKQVELVHMFVALEHRGQGLAKSLVRTLLQFARDQGYREVVLSTTILHRVAHRLYQGLGFRRTHTYYASIIWRIAAIPIIYFVCPLPSV